MDKLRQQASATMVAGYFHLFVNRRSYTIQSNRPHPRSGKHYYYRPTNGKTGQGMSLTTDTIRRHLEGEITIGLYAINPATQRCKWVTIDADYRKRSQISSSLVPASNRMGWLRRSNKAGVEGISGSSWRSHS